MTLTQEEYMPDNKATLDNKAKAAKAVKSIQGSISRQATAEAFFKDILRKATTEESFGVFEEIIWEEDPDSGEVVLHPHTNKPIPLSYSVTFSWDL